MSFFNPGQDIFQYHCWHIDTAMRKLPRNPDEMTCTRWNIGIFRELVCALCWNETLVAILSAFQMAISREMGRLALLQNGVLNKPFPSIVRNVMAQVQWQPRFRIILPSVVIPEEPLPFPTLSLVSHWWEWPDDHEAPWWKDPYNQSVSLSHHSAL